MFGGDMAGGTQRTKPMHPNRAIDVSVYQCCFDWVREQAKKIGWHLDRCVSVPEADRWYFYEGEDLIIRLEHDTVERMWNALRLPMKVQAPPADIVEADKAYQELLREAARQRKEEER